MDLLATPNTHLGHKKIKEIMLASGDKDIFFLGAGGIMMSSLALLTKRAGFSVKGSDRTRSALTERLEGAGIEMFYEHKNENIGSNCGAVVYTVAVSHDNPEYARAMSEGIPCISRADYLGFVMTEYQNRVGIAGMHGKSSCTSMCAEIFLTASKNKSKSEPTIISGAEYSSMGGAYYLGEHDDFVFEACEYMDSFLDFNPTVAVLLNAEMEHVDYFKSIEQIRDSFHKFASLVGDEGKIIYNADDENILCAIKDQSATLISFGLNDGVDFRAVNISCECARLEFDVLYRGESFTHISMPAFGMHNVYNALAAIAAAHVSGVFVADIVEGLGNFKGAKRRMEYKGEICGAQVFDDYGHHPTEVAATLSGAKKACCRRLICAFQPHTYSRTAALVDQFKCAFSEADTVILADIYAAREENIYGISSERLAEAIGDKALVGGSLDGVAELIKKNAREDDIVVVMGAGDIFKVYKLLELE